jgi:hypothetical protein
MIEEQTRVSPSGPRSLGPEACPERSRRVPAFLTTDHCSLTTAFWFSPRKPAPAAPGPSQKSLMAESKGEIWTDVGFPSLPCSLAPSFAAFRSLFFYSLPGSRSGGRQVLVAGWLLATPYSLLLPHPPMPPTPSPLLRTPHPLSFWSLFPGPWSLLLPPPPSLSQTPPPMPFCETVKLLNCGAFRINHLQPQFHSFTVSQFSFLIVFAFERCGISLAANETESE